MALKRKFRIFFSDEANRPLMIFSEKGGTIRNYAEYEATSKAEAYVYAETIQPLTTMHISVVTVGTTL